MVSLITMAVGRFFNQIDKVRSYSIYKHDTTLKMAFGAIFFAKIFNSLSAMDGRDRPLKH